MPTDYLLIDLENVIPGSISSLLENQIVLIFTGSRQSKINRDLVISTQPFGKQIEWIVIDGNGKNAADFHIAYYLGVYSKKEPAASFSILSKDTGFDPLIKHLISKSVKCRRIIDINIFSKPKAVDKHHKDIDEIVASLETYFLKCDKKMRPKKTGKFMAFVKSRGNFNDDVAKAVIEKMIAGKMIEIKDEKIMYMIDDLPF
jgi:hypothetical protein